MKIDTQHRKKYNTKIKKITLKKKNKKNKNCDKFKVKKSK